ncbi:MAG: electron transport complex subunit RsxC [Granulosicoccaceae bacterium]
MSRSSIFHGGMTLKPDKVPVVLPTEQLALQSHYAVPLTTRGGQFSEPRVGVGEKVLAGQIIGGGRLRVGVHAPTSGTVESIHTEPGDTRVVISADGEHRSVAKRDSVEPDNTTIDDLREAGLAGMGGAGFPTADKLAVALENKPQLLIVNAVECEPVISCDAQLIMQDAETLLFGADWLRRFAGAQQCQIVLEDHNQATFERLNNCIQVVELDNICVTQVPTRYPAGSERQLVHAITGTRLAPGARPLDGGALVQNAATVHALGRWAQNGTPLIERLVTIAGGACLRPQTLWCPIGTPLAALLEHAGASAESVELFQGGPIMGIPLSTGDAVTKHTQCLRIEHPAKAVEPLACIRCGLCSEACPEHLLPQQLHWQLLGNNLPGAQAERLQHCILCGCCDTVCPSQIPLSQQFAKGKADLRLRQHTEQRAAKAKQRVDARKLRLEAKEREKQERLAKRKSGTSKVDKQKAVMEALARSKAKKAASEKKQHD